MQLIKTNLKTYIRNLVSQHYCMLANICEFIAFRSYKDFLIKHLASSKSFKIPQTFAIKKQRIYKKKEIKRNHNISRSIENSKIL